MKSTTVRLDDIRKERAKVIKEKTGKSLSDLLNKTIDREYRAVIKKLD